MRTVAMKDLKGAAVTAVNHARKGEETTIFVSGAPVAQVIPWNGQRAPEGPPFGADLPEPVPFTGRGPGAADILLKDRR